MLIASCRRQFHSPRIFSRQIEYRAIPDSRNPAGARRLDPGAVHEQAESRHVCILVHGYNNTLANVLDAYSDLQARMKTAGVSGASGYGLVMGFAWPGGASATGYGFARGAADRAAGYLRQLVNHLRPVTLSVDIQTHSLGARVALGALQDPRQIFINNLLMTAAAVDNPILEPGRPFHASLGGCNRCLIYHSRKDPVLKLAYRLGDLHDGNHKALGLTGPRNKTVTLANCPNVYVVNCTECVREHGDYRRAAPVFGHWRRVLSGDALERYETA